jgi:hypothetical protein
LASGDLRRSESGSADYGVASPRASRDTIDKGQIMVIEDLEHRFQELSERIALVRSYL